MSELTRRRFYLSFIYGLGGVIGLGLAVPAALYLLLPPKLRRKDDWVEVTPVSALKTDMPTEVVYHQKRTDGWKTMNEKRTAWVVKNQNSQIVAFGPQCTHLGCAYHWETDKSQFLCPCHTSIFGVDGKVITGPAPRPLDRFETKVQKGKLMLGALRESV